MSPSLSLLCRHEMGEQNSNETNVKGCSLLRRSNLPVFRFSVVLYGLAATAQAPCYSDLTQMGMDIAAKDQFAVEDYVLCPNTFFNMDDLDDDSGISIRQNMRVLCGEDGSWENNCTLQGGNVQVRGEILSGVPDHEKTNVFLSGLTFQDARVNAVTIVTPGDVTFSDCVFQVSKSSTRNVFL